MSPQPLQILDVGGNPIAELPLSIEETRRLYEAMVVARVYDRKCSALQRQGRLATYAQFEGQEAAQIGSAAVLEPEDWLVGSYRDAAAQWYHGLPWVNLILGRTGDERGGKSPDDVRVLPPSITVGGHMIHAAGLAWAEKLKGTGALAMTLFGDGATSEGDFHEAMNFAGVYDLPVIFLCQNNGWAISQPTSMQTAAESIADKAVGYGMPGIRVDGNDVLAVFSATRDAAARARAGEGPTLIEALTYRMGPHTTSDDHLRYRAEDDLEEWRVKDPLDRAQAFLAANHAWSQEWQEAVEARAHDDVEEAVAEAEALEPLEAGDLFDAMFAETTEPLEEQRGSALRGGDA
jgi:pyruvate dehydrogenase E1 component alpha subunit